LTKHHGMKAFLKKQNHLNVQNVTINVLIPIT